MIRGERVRGIAAAACFLLMFVALMCAVFFLTSWVYHVVGHTLPPLPTQLINTVLGLLLYACLIYCVTRWVMPKPENRRRQMGVFEPIFAAMDQIARGDFQISLNSRFQANLFASELAKSVNHMALELNQLEQMRQEFIANVSHEIQSPLTSIRGFARLLHDESLGSADRRHYLGIIETETIRLSQMADSMLKLSALDAEDMHAERRPYRLDRQIRDLILACEPQWAAKSLVMEADLEDLEILAREDLLGQVWTNLLQNSIKFTPASGTIAVETRRQGGFVACRISDTGIGIPKDAQYHVFERFYKVDQSRSNPGSGLGLAIAKRIVDLHQGSMEIESEPGSGTTVSVTVPL